MTNQSIITHLQLPLLLLLLLLQLQMTIAEQWTLTSAEKQNLLDTHNRMRMQVANGLVSGQPSAANMALLQWDERLAARASQWASTCPTDHNQNYVDIQGYQQLGENMGFGLTRNLTSHIANWFSEHQHYTLEGNSCTSECGHYTQIVWANTRLIGCGAGSCNDGSGSALVCNYAAAGNDVDQSPYVTGPAASQCRGDFTWSQGGLCVAKDQCSSEAECSCSIRQGQCQNGASLNVDQCKCDCVGDKAFTYCDKDCLNDPSYGDACSSIDPADCQYYANYCKKTCNGCNDAARDKNAMPADGVNSRVPV